MFRSRGISDLKRRKQLLPVALGLTLALTALGHSQEIDYLKQVKPLLAEKCFACHGALKQESGLRLDAISLIRQGGDDGPVLVPGQADESLLLKRVSAGDAADRMPPEDVGEPLSDQQISLLKAWIERGAIAADESIPPDPRQHWAYLLPVRPTIPEVADTSWPRNDIDRFIVAAHQQRGLAPVNETSKSLLLRRVYLDLIGLPPTRAELKAFLADESPEAYEHVVGKLLGSKRYGERWARHWMDVWRYSDWTGFGNELRYSQMHIWRWRDWIVESLNTDKPYDRMIVEMLAGDEIAPDDENIARATGFLARNWYKFDRNSWLDDTVEHTAKSFLGMTVNCARCHDHKYDPISQLEYYRFRAIFEPYNVRTDQVRGQLDVAKDGLVRTYDADASVATYLFMRGDPKRPDADHPLEPGVPSIVNAPPFQVEPVSLPLESYYPSLREFVGTDLIKQQQDEVTALTAALVRAREELAAADRQLAAAGKSSESAAEANPNKPEKSSNGDKPDAVESKAEVLFVDDDFSKPRPDFWKAVRGKWEYRDGHVLQTQIASQFSPLTSATDHPADFVARLRFKTTGGNTYRSVGMSFDYVEDRDSQSVYLSANDNRPTVSAFHRRGGSDVYPSEAIAPFPIKVGDEMELEIAVRGNLLNVRVNNQLQLAYQLPVERQPGRFAIWTYDATAEFMHLSVSELPKEAALQPAKPIVNSTKATKSAQLTPQQSYQLAQQKVDLAEAKLRTAQARLAAVEARLRAEQAKYRGQLQTADSAALAASANSAADEAEAKQLALLAGKSERLAAVAVAQENLLLAEQELSRANGAANAAETEQTAEAAKATAELEKKVAASKTALEGAMQAAEQENATYQPLGTVYPQTSTGRRLALARWIADERNPLTARVAVNHIWLRHFGAPLVENVVDFGLRSPRPAHADLLDYLAVELMANGWSMKHLHRLIVTSSTYRMSSSSNGAQANLAADRDNQFWWRMNTRRMEAEAVRDAILFLAGSLDQTMGGPDLDQNQGLSLPRRSLYFRHARERQMPFLQMFDAANPEECYRRRPSIRPQQVFAMMNSSLALEQARRLAGKISEELRAGKSAVENGGESADGNDTKVADEAFINVAFETLLTRGPSASELNACREFLQLQASQLSAPEKLELLDAADNPLPASADPVQRARENLVLVLLNHNDFVMVR